MKYWLWLDGISGLGPINAKALLKVFKCPKNIYEASYEDLIAVKNIGPKLSKAITSSRSFNKAYKTLRSLKQHRVQLLTYHDPNYPSWAKDHLKAPIILYYKGIFPKLNSCTAITGNITSHHDSQRTIDHLLPILKESHHTIITGLNHGVELSVIKKNLELKGQHLIFIPYGLDLCYPKSLTAFKKSLLKEVVFISEYPLATKPLKAYYLQTYELMASWSHHLLILEATSKHSSQRIAKAVHALNRPVFLAPHGLYENFAIGSHQLLADYGKCYTHPQQLINLQSHLDL